MPTPEQIAKMAEVLGDTDWLEFLDQLDAVARRRRQRQAEPETPNGHDRDQVAAWIARRHLLADSAVRQVWYLPEAAPPNEIRFLEVNDRLCDPALTTPQVEAIDFDLDIQGSPFKLFVADISGDQLNQIRGGELHLPQGWQFNGNRVWGRRT
jgi:hypothetical protein